MAMPMPQEVNMGADIEELLSQSAFDGMEPERLELFRDFAYDIEGKSAPEIISIFMRFHKEFSKGRPITRTEKQAMVQAIGASIPPQDQGKFKTILKVVDNFI
jgi:hypothetical protein